MTTAALPRLNAPATRPNGLFQYLAEIVVGVIETATSDPGMTRRRAQPLPRPKSLRWLTDRDEYPGRLNERSSRISDGLGLPKRHHGGRSSRSSCCLTWIISQSLTTLPTYPQGLERWLSEFGKAAIRVLKPTGSFVLDLGHAYERGQPVRSLYNYRVLIAFVDDLDGTAHR